MPRKPKPTPAPGNAPVLHALKPTLRRLADLKPHPKNPNTHPPSQVHGLGSAYDEFGITSVIVVDEKDFILAGAGRVLAGQGKGIAALPVIQVTGWSERKKLAFMVSDNQWGRLSSWDDELLRSNVAELQLGGFDLDLIGFNAEAAAALLATPNGGVGDPDAAPPVPEAPVVRLGDVWMLGKHRLLCGDSTIPKDVAIALGGKKPKLMATDPPYGVNYDANWRNEAERANGQKVGARATGKVSNDDRADWREAWALFPGSVAYVWHGGLHAGVVQQSLAAAGFVTRAQIVWVKTRPVLSRGAYHWQHEPAFYVTKPDEDDQWRFVPEHEVAAYAVADGETAGWTGDHKQSTVWFIEHIKSDTGHSTQKPVECMRRPIVNNSTPGSAVYDPFCGSGTTIIACEIEGREAIAIELDPAYVQVAIERWQMFTGKLATLDGKTLEQVAKARRSKGESDAPRNPRKPVRGQPGQPAPGDPPAMA